VMVLSFVLKATLRYRLASARPIEAYEVDLMTQIYHSSIRCEMLSYVLNGAENGDEAGHKLTFMDLTRC
jgi:hypothetical protein